MSTDGQDLAVQRTALSALASTQRGSTSPWAHRHQQRRPRLREALAACREGDTLVVTKLDRLARSVPDARDIADELTARRVSLSIAGSVHDPTDPSMLGVHVPALVALGLIEGELGATISALLTEIPIDV